MSNIFLGRMKTLIIKKFQNLLRSRGNPNYKKIQNFRGPYEYLNHFLENSFGHREYPNYNKIFENFLGAFGNPNFDLIEMTKIFINFFRGDQRTTGFY